MIRTTAFACLLLVAVPAVFAQTRDHAPVALPYAKKMSRDRGETWSIVAKGLPWKLTLCVRGHIYLRDPEGATVYENRYVIWGLIRWGKLKEYEVFEDTEKTEGLDQYLAGPQLSRSSA